MSVTIDGRREPLREDQLILGFRDTVMLALGYFPDSITRSQLYQLYQRVHGQLTRIGVVSFKLPDTTVFEAMLRKLHRNTLIEELYQNQNYGIQLSEAGWATFEVIIANLQQYESFKRVANIYDFYRAGIEA